MAALLCIAQEDYLKATVGEPEYYKVYSAAFIWGTPYAFDAPNGFLIKPDYEKSKALLKEAATTAADRAYAIDRPCPC